MYRDRAAGRGPLLHRAADFSGRHQSHPLRLADRAGRQRRIERNMANARIGLAPSRNLARRRNRKANRRAI
jgi:hypothetical protein